MTVFDNIIMAVNGKWMHVGQIIRDKINAYFTNSPCEQQ